jgi:septal ring factor EnvC (AmiA/AmiB activator)
VIAAASSAQKAEDWMKRIGIVAIVGVLLGLASLVYSSWSVLQHANVLAVATSPISKDLGVASEKIDAAKKELDRLGPEVKSVIDKIEPIERQLRELREGFNGIASVQRNLTETGTEVDKLKAELDRLRSSLDKRPQ